jgi:hypothetical protein
MALAKKRVFVGMLNCTFYTRKKAIFAFLLASRSEPKVIIEKSRIEGSLMEQDTIENVS